MRHLLIFGAMTILNSLNAQQADFAKVKILEHQLEDVMEVTDTALLIRKLEEVEKQFSQNPSQTNAIRLGIIYHETALNLSFFSKTDYKGYAKKSYELLSELLDSPNTTIESIPFVASYRASALSLVSAETKNLKLLKEAFGLFSDAVAKYATVSYCPEFLRGSVAENLPWFFFKKRRYAKKDFSSIISKYEENPEYANWKIMSFTYWAWANQHQSSKFRKQAVIYLDQAIKLDPENKAGRAKAEKLKLKFLE